MDALLLAGCAVLGLLVGSFLNVVIYRVPRKESVVAPRSRCPQCETPIAPRDNVPVLSWLALRGRCRHCGARISARYPLVEVATGAIFAVGAARFGAEAALPAFLFFFAILLSVTLIDLEHYIVPNRLVVVALIGGIPLLGVAAAVDGDWGGLARAFEGGLAASASLFVVHLIQPGGLGAGDVKLALVLGLFLGWLGWGQVLLGLFLGFLFGAVVGVGLMVAGRRGRKDAVPFAPFLAAGAFVAVLVGQPILDWYRGV